MVAGGENRRAPPDAKTPGAARPIRLSFPLPTRKPVVSRDTYIPAPDICPLHLTRMKYVDDIRMAGRERPVYRCLVDGQHWYWKPERRR